MDHTGSRNSRKPLQPIALVIATALGAATTAVVAQFEPVRLRLHRPIHVL